jgi:ABC-2 type transport system permease protein
VLLASILAFAGFGLFSASYSLLFKRGNPVKWLFLGVAGLVSGIMYPVSVLPTALQRISRLVPVTYSLAGMRVALLQNASVAMLWPTIVHLLLFALVLLPSSLAVFGWALRRTKVTGTLTHF